MVVLLLFLESPTVQQDGSSFGWMTPYELFSRPILQSKDSNGWMILGCSLHHLAFCIAISEVALVPWRRVRV